MTTAINAALANGMLAHADETDDSHAPSLYASGLRHRAGRARDGRARAAQRHRACCAQSRSATTSAAGSTLALARLRFPRGRAFDAQLRADVRRGRRGGRARRSQADQVRHLLSYTAQQASGVSCWMRDAEHIEKAFDFGGMPARNGVAAATMVAHGFTGVEDVFSGERNFFVAYDETRRIGKPRARAPDRRISARRYEIMNTNIKRWSVGSPIQAPLDSLLDLIRTNNVKADDVEKLVVRVAHQGANTVDNRDMPDICMQHMCAVMLIDGIVTFESAHDEKRMKDSRKCWTCAAASSSMATTH